MTSSELSDVSTDAEESDRSRDQMRVQKIIAEPGVLAAIMDVCQRSPLYGVISHLARLSKHHRAIVQPRLKKIKKKVVLHMDDYHFRTHRNDKNVE